MPALTSELFGLQHFASNYSLVQVCRAHASKLHPAAAVRARRRASELRSRRLKVSVDLRMACTVHSAEFVSRAPAS